MFTEIKNDKSDIENRTSGISKNFFSKGIEKYPERWYNESGFYKRGITVKIRKNNKN